MAEQATPTEEQLAAGGAVAQAGVDAAKAEPEQAKKKPAAARAIRREAKKAGVDLSEDDAKMIATFVVDEMDSRGAFDPPPEQLKEPEPPAQQYQQQQDPPREPEQPRSQSFAERFRTR